MKRMMNVLLATSVAAVLAGCSSTPDRIDELETARAVVPQVEASPRAGVAAENIAAARKSLDTANRLAEKGGNTGDIQWEAYLAARNAEIANQKILTAQAQDEITRGNEERQKVLVQARAREAEAAARQAEANARDAEAAKSRALSLEDEAKRLQQELADLKAKRDERGLILTLGDVLFDVNQSTLKPGAYSTVDRLAQFLKDAADRKVVIEGHTDSTGNDDYNQSLSERRAEAVRVALLERGIPTAQITAVGKGETTPVASNDNAGGRQQNRRVEIVIQDNPGSRVASDGA